MLKKKNLPKRKRQHEFELQREKLEKEKKEKKLQAKINKMNVDGSDRKKRGGSGFQMEKETLKTKLTALSKAKLSKQWSLTKKAW
jgi:hypothetical protein